MGFGKKMDYRNSKEVDLDIIYKKVIKNLFDSLVLKIHFYKTKHILKENCKHLCIMVRTIRRMVY